MPSLPPYYFSLSQVDQQRQQGVIGLMYHKVARPRCGWRGEGLLLYVSPKLFRRQMQEIHASGVLSVLPDEVLSLNARGKIWITFDDGFENVFNNALEILGEFGLTSINYLVHDLIGKTNAWDAKTHPTEKLMDRSQVREWLSAGQLIGSHTLTHPFLTKIPQQQARSEIIDSKKRLEDLFGVPIEHFCYPYGDNNPAIRELVEEAGYHTACTIKFGMITPDTPRAALPRIMVRYPKWNVADWIRLLAPR